MVASGTVLIKLPLKLLWRGSLKKAGWEEEDDGENARESVRETAQETARGRSRGRGNGRTDRPLVAAESEFPKWQLFLVTLLVFGAIQAIRFLAIGTLAPAGTGGTEVADTFSLADSISHAWEQAAFVFGRNSGPDYLCILPYEDSPDGIRLLILLSNLVLFAAVALFAVCAVRDRSRLLIHLRNAALFLVFIAMCIGSSSVTIRVEMRWVYVVFALALCLVGAGSAMDQGDGDFADIDINSAPSGPDMVFIFVDENGSLYYYVDGTLTPAGLIQIDGDYYYVKTSNCEVVHGRTYWVTVTNGLLPSAQYTFADDGKMILE